MMPSQMNRVLRHLRQSLDLHGKMTVEIGGQDTEIDLTQTQKTVIRSTAK